MSLRLIYLLFVLVNLVSCNQEININMSEGRVAVPPTIDLSAVTQTNLHLAEHRFTGPCPFNGANVNLTISGINQTVICSNSSWSATVNTLALPLASHPVVIETVNPSTSESITVVKSFTRTNLPPVLDAIPNFTVNENVPLSAINAGDGGDDFDADLQQITYSCYFDTVVNGTVAGSTLCTTLAGVSFNTATGVMNWTPSLSQSGSYEFKIIGSDGSLSDDELFSVTVLDVLSTLALDPIADQSVSENVAITQVDAGVGGDDLDPDSQAVTYSCYFDTTVNGAVANTGLCTSLTGVSFNTSTGILNWTPSYSQAGSYEFKIVGTNGSLSDEEIFAVVVANVNLPPVLDAIADQTVSENSAVAQVNAGDGGDDLDADNQAITYSCYYDSTIDSSVSTTSLCTALTGVSFNASTGILNWTPSYDQAGAFEFKIVGSDGSLSDDELFSITVSNLNRAPVLDPIADQTVYENVSIAQINAGDGIDDFDADLQAITYSCYYDTQDDGSVTQTTLCTSLTGVTFNTATGVLDWKPSFSQSGTYEFKIIGSDGSLSDDEVFVVSVTDVPATKLSFTTEPSTTGIAGAALETQPRVSFLSSSDVVVTNQSASVTLALYTDAGCTTPAAASTYGSDASLVGTLTVPASSGVSTFTNVQINLAANPLYLRASSGTLTSDCSTAINVSPGAYSLAESVLSVSATSVASSSSVTVTLTARDALGNANPSGVGAVTFGSTLIGGTGTFGATMSAGGGVYTAAFTGVKTGSVTLSGLINTASISDTETITVTPGVPASIAIVSGNNQTAYAATPLAADHVVVVKDANANLVPGVQIDWSVIAGGGSYPTATSLTNASGNASNRYTNGTNGLNTTRATISSTSYWVEFTSTGGTPPTISDIPDTTAVGTVEIPFTIDDAETALVCSTAVTATSSNAGVIAVGAISFSGTAPDCVATFTKNPTETGVSTITLTVNDGTETAQDSFNLTFTTGWYQEAYIKASNADMHDMFGYSTSLSGDTIAVGVPFESSNQTTITNGSSSSADNSLSDSGAVYVYKRAGAVWTQEAYIKAANAGANDYFGNDVSIQADTLIVGAPYESSNQTSITNGPTASADDSLMGSGAVYVYKRTGTSWSQQAYIKAPNAKANTQFGRTFSLSGDSLAISSIYEDSNQTTITTDTSVVTNDGLSYSGAVYVYARTGASWALEAFIKASNAGKYDYLGYSISLNGDTLVVSAPYEDSDQTSITNGSTSSASNSALDSGAVYVYKRRDTIWSQEAYIKAANAESYDFFGASVSLSGDTLTVGATRESSVQTSITNGPTASSDNSSSFSGATYVFKRSLGNWTQEAYIKASNTQEYAEFGTRTFLEGNTLVVTAPYESSDQTTITNGPSSSSVTTSWNTGAAFVYKRSGTTWTQDAYIKASNADEDDYFGESTMGLSGDTIVVASTEDSSQLTITNGPGASADNSLEDAGAVYVFRNSSRLFEPGELAVKPQLTSLLLSWQTAGQKAAGYKIAYDIGNTAPANCNSGTVVDVGNVLSYNLGSLAEDTIYSLRICSYDSTAAQSEGYTATFKTRARLVISDFANLTSIGSLRIPFTIKAFSSSLTCAASVSVTSSNAGVLADGAVSITGTAPSCFANITKDAMTALGSTTLTFTLTDGFTSVQKSFLLTFGSGWYQEAYIKAPNPDSNDNFGVSASLSGNTLVVGASYEDSSQTTITNGTTASSNNTVADSGAAYIYKRTGPAWAQEAFVKASNANASDYFGYAVAVSGDTMVASARYEDSSQNTITNGASSSTNNSNGNSGAAYVYKRTGSTWAQEAYLKPSNNGTSDEFGISAAISGDTIVIGAWGEDSNQTTVTNGAAATTNNSTGNSGAAYVFKRTGSTWAEEAYLKAPNPNVDDYFGWRTAISGDTIIVSARDEDSNQSTITNGTTASADNSFSKSGAVYVFRRTGNTWAHEAYIKASNPDIDDWFGHSLSVSGDTIVVGAYYEDSNQSTITNGTTASSDNSGSNTGAAYVYRRSGTSWAQEAYVKPSAPSFWGMFGYSVSVSGDTMVIGSSGNSSSQNTITNGATTPTDQDASYSGAAYVFKRVGAVWSQEAFLKANNAELNDNFGSVVAINGDTIAIGVESEDSSQTTITNGTFNVDNDGSLNSGAVYIFRNNARVFEASEFLAKTKASDAFILNWQTAGHKAAGYKIAYAQGAIAPADCNSGTVIDVGNVLTYNISSLLENTAYSFRICSYDAGMNLTAGYTTTFRTTNRPTISDITNKTSTGTISVPFTIADADSTLTCTGSVTAASSNSATIGVDAISFSGTAPNCTATFTKDPASSGVSTITLTVSDGVSSAQDSFILTFTSGWYQEAYIKAPNAESGDWFGYSSSISGNTLVIGAYREDSNQTTITNGATASADNSAAVSGAAYVFKRSGSTWIQEAYIKAPNAEANDSFGISVSASNDSIVVGAYGEGSNQTTITNGTTASADNSAAFAGAAYVFRRTGSTWAQEAYIKTSNSEAGDRVGESVSISGDTLVVGAIGEASANLTVTNGPTASSDNSAGSLTGAAYVFKRTGNTWVQDAYLKAGNAENGDNFGYSVSISGDTIAVGAYQEDSSETFITHGILLGPDNANSASGAVYIYQRSGTSWSQEAYVKASNSQADDYFGSSVSISGDTLVVGAYGEDSSQTTITNGTTSSADNSALGAGAAYIYKRTGTGWSQEAYIKASNAEASDTFGQAVSVNGDTVVVTATGEDSNLTTITNATTSSSDNSVTNSGAVYVYKRTGSTWAQEAYLKASNARASQRYGISASISGDTIVVGADFENSNQTTITNGQTASADTSASTAGAAYVYRNSVRLFQVGELFLTSSSPTSVALKWNSAGTKATGYKVTYQTGATAPADCSSSTDVGTSLTHTESGLASGTTYTFKVCSYDGTTTANGPSLTVTTP